MSCFMQDIAVISSVISYLLNIGTVVRGITWHGYVDVSNTHMDHYLNWVTAVTNVYPDK
jgi:hypothetical protein